MQGHAAEVRIAQCEQGFDGAWSAPVTVYLKRPAHVSRAHQAGDHASELIMLIGVPSAKAFT